MQYPFPTSAHSYFKIRNLTEAKQDFFDNSAQHVPVFVYGTATEALVGRRLARVEDEKSAKNLQLVLASLRLRAHESIDMLDEYSDANKNLFEEPIRFASDQILAKIEARQKPHQYEEWQYIAEQIPGYETQPHTEGVSDEVFARLRDYFEIFAHVSQYRHLSLQLSLPELLEVAIDKTGLKAKGWQMLIRDGNKHARTVHRKKYISVGRDYLPRSNHAKLRIVVHEVFGHALRGPQAQSTESEGFATLLEQLTKSKYTFRRSYRYLAASLGWGVYGRPMNFLEVYEILWRSMVIMSSYDIDKAKRHAFDECARVFRGGLPGMKGAVFLKDSLYFSANQQAWEVFMGRPVSYEQFVAIIEGRKQVLS